MTNFLPTSAVPAHLAEHEHDEQACQRGYVKGTDFAPPYFSPWSRLHEAEVRDGLLRHVNCGYLSTHGAPPTLLALKQHAQALCMLIHALNPTLKSAEIGVGGGGSGSKGKGKKGAARDGDGDETPPSDREQAVQYALNDAFDFLTDLTTPYTNPDPNHHKPLNALINEVRSRTEAAGSTTTTYHCPLAASPAPRAKGAPQRPYASHHNLIMHTNACLERLDHEFSSTGGLLSLLPPPPPQTPTPSPHPTSHLAALHADLSNARNSLLGQWLHFTQSLVARTHELSRSYAAALDLLAGEAAIPLQHLSALGPDGRAAGRVVAFPQDRWVLANAGEDVLGYVHGLLDKEEAVWGRREGVWRGNGVVSSSERERGRGVVSVDLVTRYYRLTGRGRDTVFVLPAWGGHPGVKESREAEGKPTVVACPAAKFPVRASELEKRFTERVERGEKAERENVRVKGEMERAKWEAEALREQNKMLVKARDALVLGVADAGEMDAAGRVHEQRERAGKAEGRVKELERERDEVQAREEELRDEVEGLQRELVALRARFEKGKGGGRG